MGILSYGGLANHSNAKSKLRRQRRRRSGSSRQSVRRRRLQGEFLEPRIALAVAPIAAPDAGSVGTVDGFNAPLVMSAASGLLANDSAPDLGDEITFRFQGAV